MSQRIHAFTDDALGTLDAIGVADVIKNKEVSVREVTEAAIRRMEKVEPQLQSVVLTTLEDARGLKGVNQNGRLYGVPAFVKDNSDLIGYPTQFGTGVFKARLAKKNAKFVDQMLSTGLNFLGKTTLPEFGLNCSTENGQWGVSHNPWDLNLTPGGSSSGSGAMVASGVVPIAHANDGAGSTRIPAACCGLVGLKPSRNRLVNFDGSEVMPINIGYQGVLTRSVRDTAAFYEDAEKFYRNNSLPSMVNVKNPVKRRLKIAFIENPAEGEAGHMDEDTYRVQVETAKLLESLGHEVEQIKMPLRIEEMMHYFLNYYGYMAFLLTRLGRILVKSPIDHSQLEPFSYGLTNNFLKNILEFPRSVSTLRNKIKAMENQLMSQYDILMTPVTTMKTPKIGYLSPLLSSKEIIRRASYFAPYTGLQNVSGAPAISLPLGRDSDSNPLGVQLAAAYGYDALLLELAYELEAAQPWKHLYEV